MADLISYGDNVRIARTPETERLGIAGMVGNVYGDTTPSESGVEVIGDLNSDYAFNVYFESRDAAYWFAPHLLEFVDHAPGTEIHVHGSPFKSVHQRDGTWKDVPVNQDSPSWLRRLVGRLRRTWGVNPVSHSIPSAEAYASERVRYPPLEVIDIAREAAAVTDDYRNQVLSRVNTSCLRLAVISGEYPWHRHPRSDELFLVMEGRFEIELEDGRNFRLGPWQSVVVPAGTVHRTRGVGRTVNLCFEAVAAETESVGSAP